MVALPNDAVAAKHFIAYVLKTDCDRKTSSRHLWNHPLPMREEPSAFLLAATSVLAFLSIGSRSGLIFSCKPRKGALPNHHGVHTSEPTLDSNGNSASFELWSR